MEIISAIQEIIMQDDPSASSSNISAARYPWLSAEYLEIVNNQETIKYGYMYYMLEYR